MDFPVTWSQFLKGEFPEVPEHLNETLRALKSIRYPESFSGSDLNQKLMVYYARWGLPIIQDFITIEFILQESESSGSEDSYREKVHNDLLKVDWESLDEFWRDGLESFQSFLNESGIKISLKDSEETLAVEYPFSTFFPNFERPGDLFNMILLHSHN